MGGDDQKRRCEKRRDGMGWEEKRMRDEMQHILWKLD